MTDDAPDREKEAAAIADLCLIADRMAGDEWAFDNHGREFHLWTRRSTGEQEHICTIHAAALDDERELICGALTRMLMFLRMFSRAAQAVRALKGQLRQRESEARKSDYTTQAAMLLNDRRFQRFLETKGAGGPVRDAGAADTRLKSILRLESKKQLNGEEWAREAWKRLMGEFDAWRRAA